MADLPLADQRAPDCLRCRAYYVTHDPMRPHGCRTFGFRSRALPRDEVRLSSGQECGAFEAKPARPGAQVPPRARGGRDRTEGR